MRRLATHAAWIINHRTPAMGEKRRKTISADDLMGRARQEVAEQFSNAADFQKHLRAQAQRRKAV